MLKAVRNDVYNKLCVPNKTQELNIHVFNMITGMNESKILKEYISCECKCKFDGIKCNSDQKWNNDKYRCEKTSYIWKVLCLESFCV